MYDHEVLISLQTPAKVFRTHFLHCYVAKVKLGCGEWQFILWKNVGNTARPDFIVKRTKRRPTALWFINKNTATFNSNFTRSSLWARSIEKAPDHKVSSHVEISMVTDTVNWRCRMCPEDLCSRIYKAINTSWRYMASPWNAFCNFVSPILL
jgi:hypothetical protein